MNLFDIFQALQNTSIGQFIRDSLWLFPAIEAVHLVGLSLLGGTILVVDLRLLNLGLKSYPTSTLYYATRPYFYLSLVLLFSTGIPLMLSEAIKLYYSDAYWVKMITLILALIFTFTVRNQVAKRPVERRLSTMITGFISISLWFTVATAGRWIGFS